MNDIKPRTVYLLRRTDKEEDDGTDTYIGSTSKPLKYRLKDHRGNTKRCNSKLYVRMAEVGLENWTIEPLLTFSCDKKTIYDFEREWIKLIKPDLNVRSSAK